MSTATGEEPARQGDAVWHAAARESARSQAAPATGGYIVGPLYDSVFFIYAPTLACVLMILWSALMWLSPEAFGERHFGPHFESPAAFVVGAMTMGHLFAVVFRSHANPKIFRLYPLRFTLVPAVLLAAVWSSLTVAILIAILGAWWDVYHSSLQTFGLGRIYDSRLGNDWRQGRRLDYLLNLLLYAGPILSGASLAAHASSFHIAGDERLPAAVRSIASLTPWLKEHALMLRGGIIVIGLAFIAFYVWSYARLARGGYQVSQQKVGLLASTATTSILAWGLNPAGTAFLIMNFFHAWQYFGLVWILEKKTIHRTFGFGGEGATRWWPIPLALYVLVLGAYGTWAWLLTTNYASTTDFSPLRLAVGVSLTVSICHFWYDGFIWSVGKKQV